MSWRRPGWSEKAKDKSRSFRSDTRGCAMHSARRFVERLQSRGELSWFITEHRDLYPQSWKVCARVTKPPMTRDELNQAWKELKPDHSSNSSYKAYLKARKRLQRDRETLLRFEQAQKEEEKRAAEFRAQCPEAAAIVDAMCAADEVAR